MQGHDVIVIGASAGGVDLLLELVPELPADLPSAIFVVLHTRPDHASELPELLSRRGPLPASHPVHREPFAPGRIYIAPPDNHLLVRGGFVEVVRGARENGHRPAVDPLFRTASWAYGPRVVGVVLSGHQDCGTAGMMSVKARGGIAVVQEPASAHAPEMPESVLANVEVDHVVHPLELAGLLVRLAAQSAPARESAPPPEIEALEGRAPGAPVLDLVCPACQGVLRAARVGEFERFACHVGHAFTTDALVRAQGEEVERALWAAVRALEESAAMGRRLSPRFQDPELRRRLDETRATKQRQAETIRQILLEGGQGPGLEGGPGAEVDDGEERDEGAESGGPGEPPSVP